MHGRRAGRLAARNVRAGAAVSGVILVTGASGFVGRSLVAHLARAGKQVRAATRQPEAIVVPVGVEVVGVPDFAGAIAWEPLLADVAAVVHLAGIAHIGASVSAAAYERVNRQATAEFAAACAGAHVSRLVFMSSIRAQSGPLAPGVLTEADPPRPTEAYGRSKLAAEGDVRASGVQWTILRPTAIYGPGVKGNFATLLRLARQPLPLPFAGFNAKRSLLSLDNLQSAIDFVLAEPATVGETYIVADPVPVSLAEIIAAMREGLGRKPGLIPLPQAGLAALLRLAGRGDVWERIAGALVADPGKLIAAGWRPERDTLGGLARMAAASA